MAKGGSLIAAPGRPQIYDEGEATKLLRALIKELGAGPDYDSSDAD